MKRATRIIDNIGSYNNIDSGKYSYRYTTAKLIGRLKPKSLTKFNEIRLIYIIYRYGTEIRYLNLYGEEDRGSTLRLI